MSLALRQTSKARFVAAVVVSAVALTLPSAASGATLTATPATLGSVFAGAGEGDTIALASGDYGTFRGSLKSGMVTLTPQTGAAVTVALDFAPASNITIDGVTLTEAVIGDSRTKNIIVRNSDVPGQVTLRTGELASSNILLERNVHHDFDPDGGGEGRIFLPESTSQPSGITIRNSEFRGGTSDGIQNGSNGTVILNNDFHDLEPGQGPHTDSIQLYGSHNTVIRGNYFHDLNGAPAIMAPDGADHEIIEDNVVRGDSGGYPFAISLGSDNGSLIAHNTLADGSCDYNLHCGILALGSKAGDPAGHDTVVANNIFGEITINGDAGYTAHHNLVRRRAYAASDIVGVPTFVGGVSPTTLTGYVLAGGSLGKGNASDGLDRGARIDEVAPLAPDQPPAVESSTDDRSAATCKQAKAKLRRARKRLKRASGHRAKVAARRKVRDARKRKREAC